MVTGRGHSLLWPRPALLSGGLLRLLRMLCVIALASAVCPYCFGNIDSCTFNQPGGTCPACEVPAQNAGVVGGLTALVSAGTALTLTNVVRPRFLRMFTKAHLTALLQLVRRPVPGTIFEVKQDTKLSVVLQAVSVGQITIEHAMIAYAGFIDGCDPDSEKEKLQAFRETYKLLSSTKDMAGFAAGSTASADVGVWTWLYGKVSVFVAEKGMQTTVTLDTGSVLSEGNKATVLSTTIKRFKNPWDFMEALNLFMMFAVSLGLCTCTVMAEFYEFVVFDTIRMRGHPWQMAAEVLVVMLRRIEDSAGALTLVSATDEVHMNTVLDEARANTAHHHGEAVFFRTSGGNPHNPKQAGVGVKFNGKFTATSQIACVHFNSGGEHPASALLPDGTCKFNHVCDHWVSNKGKAGRCMGTAGTPGHTRRDCDDPHRCDAKQQ